VSNSLSLFQDLIHSAPSTVSIFKRRLRRFVTANPAEEKSREDFAMAGINSISRAIFDKFWKSVYCFGSLYRLIAFSKSLWGGVRMCRWYSSPARADLKYLNSQVLADYISQCIETGKLVVYLTYFYCNNNIDCDKFVGVGTWKWSVTWRNRLIFSQSTRSPPYSTTPLDYAVHFCTYGIIQCIKQCVRNYNKAHFTHHRTVSKRTVL
jgi:hypothetical protein